MTALAGINAIRLPFDQYGRYTMIRQAIDATRSTLGSPLRILDVGGFYRTGRGQDILPVRAFLPDDDVTVVDQHPVDLPGYIQGDGRKLPFHDQAFDFVISCDTLEHVPAAGRPAFWRELLRLGRHGVLLAAPFASPEVVLAESILFAYIQAELGVEHGPLKEHRDNGLPDLQATCALLTELGMCYRVYPSGYVHAWLAMMIAKHYLFARSDNYDLHEQVDEYYTRFLSANERREPAYRHMFLVARAGHPDQAAAAATGWLAAADAVLAPTICTTMDSTSDRHNGAAQNIPGWPELASWILHLVGLNLQQRQLQPLTQAMATQASTIQSLQHSHATHEAHNHSLIQPLTQATAAQAQTIQALQQTLALREAQIQDLEQRARWREEQAQAAMDALKAVEQGRLLRLMRWFRKGSS